MDFIFQSGILIWYSNRQYKEELWIEIKKWNFNSSINSSIKKGIYKFTEKENSIQQSIGTLFKNAFMNFIDK